MWKVVIMFKNKYINNLTLLLPVETSGWLFVYAVTHLTILCHIRDGAGVVLSQIIAIMQQINKT